MRKIGTEIRGDGIDSAYLQQLHDSGLEWAEIAARTGLPSANAASTRAWRHRKRGAQPTQPDFPQIILPDEFDLDGALDVADKLQGLLDSVDPIVTSAELFFPDKPMAIMWTSCAHLGGRYTWHEGIREAFDKILKIPNLYVALLGDEIEGFLPGFRDASAVADQVLPIKIQRKMLAAYLRRWSEAGKVLFGCNSQHGGQWFESAVGLNPIKEEFQTTGTPFFDGKGILKLWIGPELYIAAVAHSFKGSSIYNPNHPQRRVTLFDYPSADVAAMGDKHRYSVQHMSDRVDEYRAGLRPSPLVWHVQVGTAKTGSDPYTIRGWQHGYFEWPVLVFYPDRHVIKQCFEIGDLEWMLR